MKTKQWLTKTILAGCVSAAIMLGMSTTAFAEDKVVATVNGEKITEASLQAVMTLLKRSNPGITEKMALDDLVATQLVLQQAKASGVAEREDVKQKLKEFEERLILQAWTEDTIKTLAITDEDVKKVYDQEIAKMGKQQEYKARHILVKTAEEAKALITELEGGKDFAELAKEKSTGPSGKTGGDLGWFKSTSMVKPFSDAVQSMEKDSISKEPVQTQFGFHVIKLEDQREAKLPELKSMEAGIKRALEQEKMKAHIDGLVEKADVQIMLEEKAEEKAEAKPAEQAKEEAK